MKSVRADVTSLVGFALSSPSVAVVEEALLQGLYPGTSQVSVVIAAPGNPSVVLPRAVDVEVTTEKVRIESLNVVVYTGAVWVAAPGVVSADAVVEPRIQLKNSITRE